MEPNAKQNVDVTLKSEMVAACNDTFKFHVCVIVINIFLGFNVFA